MKLEVESCDEVYYPAVSVVYLKTIEASEVVEPVERIEPEVSKTELASEEEPAVLSDAIQETDEAKSGRHGWKLWGSRFGNVVVTVVAVCAVALVGMRLMGFRTFTVMSGSMSPEYPVGALIYVKPVDYQTLKVGDVISFVADDENTVVTHRIVGVEVDEKDSSVLRFKTQGDANAMADANLVHYKNVLGSPIITVPFIGYVAHNIQQPPGIYIALVVGTLLLAWTFLPGTLEERRKTARKSVA